jgi:hypothetical protein
MLLWSANLSQHAVAQWQVKRVVLRDRSRMFVILITCLDGVSEPVLSEYPSMEDL